MTAARPLWDAPHPAGAQKIRGLELVKEELYSWTGVVSTMLYSAELSKLITDSAFKQGSRLLLIIFQFYQIFVILI